MSPAIADESLVMRWRGLLPPRGAVTHNVDVFPGPASKTNDFVNDVIYIYMTVVSTRVSYMYMYVCTVFDGQRMTKYVYINLMIYLNSK